LAGIRLRTAHGTNQGGQKSKIIKEMKLRPVNDVASLRFASCHVASHSPACAATLFSAQRATWLQSAAASTPSPHQVNDRT
jgi:hypothetical protein